MNKIVKKILAILLMILMIVSISNNTLTYATDVLTTAYNNVQSKIMKLTSGSNNTVASSYDLMITNRRNNNQAYKASAVAKNINTGEAAEDYGVLLLQDNLGQYYFCMEKGGALMLYANGGSTLREYYYTKQENYRDNLTHEQWLVLAYINADEVDEIGGVNLNSNNNRQKLIQYYIWKSSINEGRSVTVPSIYANAISSLQTNVNNKITVGKDVLNLNDGTLLIDGVKYKVDFFAVDKYTSKLIYRIDNGKGYIENNYTGAGQELITIDSGLKKAEESAKVLFKKIDNVTKEPISGVEFEIIETIPDAPDEEKLVTDKNGYIDLSDYLKKDGDFLTIKETQAPDKYEYSDNTIDIKLKDENGKLIVIGDVTWGNDIYRIQGTDELVLEFENKRKVPEVVLFKKIDSVTKEPISGVRFEILETVQEAPDEDYLVTDENGYIDLTDYIMKPGDWIDLKEVSAPSIYDVNPDNRINIKLKEVDGKQVLEGSATFGETVTTLKGTDELVIELENKRRDVPTIQIYKHDDKGTAVPGVEFTIVNYPRELTLSTNKLTVQNNGYTNIIDINGMENNKTYTFTLQETNTPKGYKKLTSDITLNVIVNDDGKVFWNATWNQNNNTITRNGTSKEILLDVENEKEETITKNIDLQILKVDSDDKKPLSGAEFSVTGCVNGTLTSGENGYTNILKSDNLEAGKTYEISVVETKAPSTLYKNASKVPEIVIQITVSKDGNISSPIIKSTNNQGVGISYDAATGKIILTVGNTKKKADEAYPMLMYIKGIVFLDGIEGKESNPNGYYNPDNNSDKALEGVKVELFDETTNAIAVFPTKETFTITNTDIHFDSSSVDFDRLAKYGSAIQYTDKDGKFEFYGLNPSHKYSVIFTYNGMRYAEIKATTETGIDIAGYKLDDENASKATEMNRQSKIENVFSEIGTYPYNYKSEAKGGAYNIAYNQDDVVEAIKTGLSKAGTYEKLYENLSNYVDESMAYFIQDTLVSAKISGLGDILRQAEEKVMKANGDIKKVAGEYVYPIVEAHNTPTVDKVKFEKTYRYMVQAFYASSEYSEPSWHTVEDVTLGTLSYDARNDEDWDKVKDNFIKQDADLTKQIMDICSGGGGNARYIPIITGNWTEIKDGYSHKTIAGVEWAIFDVDSERYLGEWDTSTKSVTYEEEYKLLKDNLKELNEASNGNLVHANLGVQYRSTFDMSILNDVMKAEVTMNNKFEEYLYNKRAANGTTFNFGVNEADIKSYYSNLSQENVEAMRNIKYSNSVIGTEEYFKYIDASDIFFDRQANKTDNGIAVAGGYDETEDSIYLTYKITVTNQTSIKGKVTEIVDYYDKNFEVTKVYDKDSKEYEFSANSIYQDRGSKKAAPEGYNAVYIKLGDKELGNAEKIELYLVLKMKDIKSTLTQNVLNSEDGYKVLNVAEINGYKTEHGYIDYNSMPGNIVEDGKDRFANGKYENDESKSPTLIFKNPTEVGRTLSGIVFEDKTQTEWANGVTRQSTANHIFDENDTVIKGATVQLIQILPNGIEKLSAETRTADNGSYKFIHLRPGNYVVRFAYGNNDATTLTTLNKTDDQGNSINVPNAKSYNGESFENTERKINSVLGAEGYWYTDSDVESNAKYSDAIDNAERRNEVTNNFAILKNTNAEILSSYKDSKVNRNLINELKTKAYMYATTDVMSIELEYVGSKNPDTEGTRTIVKDDGRYTYEYDITDVDFGIVERSRAKLELAKKVSYIELVDTTGNVISKGTYEDWKAGNIKHVKWVQNEAGFVSMEIDSELLSGATLKITYDITVLNNSELGNDISEVEVVDYVTNNLNYAGDYVSNLNNTNSSYGWQAITTDTLIKEGYVNEKSYTSSDAKNKIDLSTYQTILKAKFKPGETKQVTLQKNLSSDEESSFEYNNIVEIVSSKNAKGRGDYESIYGNLDPITYTSRQGNLYWDFKEGVTTTADHVTEITENSGFNAIRKAELDSASAEEVTLTVPTGSDTFVIPGEYLIFGFTLIGTLVAMLILTKKHSRFAL